MARWRCVRCGRTFARRKQAHSCQVVPLSRHLEAASPEARAVYGAVLTAVKACGPFQAVPTKTAINLLSETSLGGMKFRKDGVDLELVLTRKLEDPRVTWFLQLSPRSFVHRVPVRSVKEVDAQLRAWIREAYGVGRMAGRRAPPKD